MAKANAGRPGSCLGHNKMYRSSVALSGAISDFRGMNLSVPLQVHWPVAVCVNGSVLCSVSSNTATNNAQAMYSTQDVYELLLNDLYLGKKSML